MTETYLAPTILTRAHFFGADASLANSTGNTFSTSLDQHGWYYDVEHITGLTIDVRHCEHVRMDSRCTQVVLSYVNMRCIEVTLSRLSCLP